MRKPVTRSDTALSRAADALRAAFAALNETEARHIAKKYAANAAWDVARQRHRTAKIATLDKKAAGADVRRARLRVVQAQAVWNSANGLDHYSPAAAVVVHEPALYNT